MQVGVFAKTFPGSEPTGVLAAVRDAGFAATQFNLACAGLPSMPDAVPDAAIDTVGAAAKATGISLVALSGTYNMAHPDSRMRQDGLRRLAVVIETAARLSIPLVTLCTGTRNAEDQWAYHPDNSDPTAWADMAREMEKALRLAERHGIDLGIEPEQANIVTSAEDAIRLIGEMGSKRLRIVLDPANLFERANAEQARSIVAEAVECVAGHVSLA
ncbi:MAG: sugar phosphate isomerase/epimerase, partial [Mesorhizobium sp.]